ncbi:hypothetical protein [Geomonas propionica]|uniref:Integral membrane protein n=1 Tax=Geomonas propionica TaxID=2798582 RepID=A0ABS0YNA0_9BACT|nr:hypothetical protein [Geomonas propionica]MBJ6799429.1 hypothetical protein [Geomonas propionica]
MDSPFFALFIWSAIGAIYGVFFWSLYLAIKMKIETGSKVLLCVGLSCFQPVASLVFIVWYFHKHKTLRPA